MDMQVKVFVDVEIKEISDKLRCLNYKYLQISTQIILN